MPRFFFHVMQDSQAKPDSEGVELPDIAAVRATVVVASGEALRDLGPEFWRAGEWQMVVADSAGRTVCTLKVTGS